MTGLPRWTIRIASIARGLGPPISIGTPSRRIETPPRTRNASATATPSTPGTDVDLRLPDCCRAAVSDTEGEVVTRSVARTGADPPDGDQDMSQQLHRIRGIVVAAILAVAIAAVNVAPAFAGKGWP